jgi:hypothetical protein
MILVDERAITISNSSAAASPTSAGNFNYDNFLFNTKNQLRGFPLVCEAGSQLEKKLKKAVPVIFPAKKRFDQQLMN